MDGKIRLIIDTDPGQDDAAAILAAHGLARQGLVDFLGLTAVAGNAGVDLTAKNTRIICDWAGREDFPVYAGAGKPLLRESATAPEMHGKTGMEGTPLHEPNCPLQKQHAVSYLAETLNRADDASITLCAIGPLTNIALALSLAPESVRAVKRIVVMGGNYFEAGNITPAAEFNFFTDPHAAQIVLQSGAPITILPLDVTRKAQITNERMNRLRRLDNTNGRRLADILQSCGRYDIQQFGLEGGPLHDPCAVFYAVFPEWFSGRMCRVDVETQNGLSAGACIVDWHGTTGKTPNALWISDVDAERMFDGLVSAIAQLP